MKLFNPIALAAIIGSSLIVANSAESQTQREWSIRHDHSRRFDNCIIMTPAGSQRCIGVSFTSGNYSQNLHFNLNNMPQRGITFAYPKTTSSTNFDFYAIADSRKNVMQISGNCMVRNSSVHCITRDGKIQAKAWR